jgi:hypothetical protein
VSAALRRNGIDRLKGNDVRVLGEEPRNLLKPLGQVRVLLGNQIDDPLIVLRGRVCPPVVLSFVSVAPLVLDPSC